MRKTSIPVETETTGGKLQAARLAAGLTLRQMEARTGINGGFLSKVEHNVVKLSPNTIASYERALGHTIEGVVPTTRYSWKRRKDLPAVTPCAHGPFQLLAAGHYTLARLCSQCGATDVSKSPYASWTRIKEPYEDEEPSGVEEGTVE